jgi:hypothetical protein
MAANHRVRFRDERTIFSEISLTGKDLPPISALLAISSITEISSLELPGDCDEACLTQLWNCLDSFRNKQTSMLSLVLDLPFHSHGWRHNSPAHIGIIIQAVERSIALPVDNPAPRILSRLSLKIRDLTNTARQILTSIETWGGIREKAEYRALIANGDRVHALTQQHMLIHAITPNQGINRY